MKSSSKITFMTPTEIKAPKTVRLGEIGKMLISSKQNYEEAFIKGAGNTSRTKPQVTEEIIVKVLGSLGIKLEREFQMELSQYCADRAQGSQKVI
jgi:hypothetical protein